MEHPPIAVAVTSRAPAAVAVFTKNFLHPKYIPVIAVSANAMLLDIEKGLVAGFYSYITKPINVDLFIHSVNEGLKFVADSMLKCALCDLAPD